MPAVSQAKVALMRKIPLFEGLTEHQLLQLTRLADDVIVTEGKKLATAGETGKQMFVIISGKATVKTLHGRSVRLGPGDFFGEMSLIDGEPRSATVVAETPMQLLVLGQREFWELLAEAPQINRKIMTTLSRRLRESDAAFTTLS